MNYCKAAWILNVANEYGQTPLHMACECGSKEIVGVLLSKGANPNAVTLMGYTPLLVAMCTDANSSKNNIIQLLLDKGANPNIPNVFGVTPVYFLLFDKDTSLLKMLLPYTDAHFKHKAWGNITLLHFAVKAADATVFHMVLNSHKEAVNDIDDRGWTPLHYACLTASLEKVQALVKEKANVNIAADGVMTPMRSAVIGMCAGNSGVSEERVMKYCAIIEFLALSCKALRHTGGRNNGEAHIEEVIDIVLNDTSFLTKLYYHIFGFGATSDDTQFTITHRKTKEVSGVEAKYGAPLYQVLTKPAQEDIDAWIAGGGDINIQDYYGRTPLHYACVAKECSSKLLKSGSDVTLKDNMGNTALHIACRKRADSQAIKLLLDYKSNINEVNNYGETALHIVCSLHKLGKHDPSWQAEVIKLLIDNGADASIKDEQGIAPSDMFEVVDGNVVLKPISYDEAPSIKDVCAGATVEQHDDAGHLVSELECEEGVTA